MIKSSLGFVRFKCFDYVLKRERFINYKSFIIIMIKNCVICNREFGTKKETIICCSKKCKDKYRYINNKESILLKIKEWKLKNPEKVKKYQKISMKNYVDSGKMKMAMKREYEKNKDKWHSRTIAHYYRKTILESRNNCCEICKSTDKLNIHHIDYEWKKQDIRTNTSNLFLNLDKVKVLCKSCHNKEHNK